jgi:tetratricopeptide (TPR) repeat protein
MRSLARCFPAAVFLLVAVGVGRAAEPSGDGPSVAVFDLQVTNKRHDSFGERFAEAVRQAVDASGTFTAFPEAELKRFVQNRGGSLEDNLLADEAVKLGADLGVEFVLMGFMFKQTKDYSATVRVIQVSSGRELLPPVKLTVGTSKKDQEAAAAQLVEQLQASPREEAARHYRFGQDYFVAGNYTDAATAFERAIAADPKMWEAYYAAGAAYGKLGELEKAEQKFSEVLARNPEYAEGYQARGDHYRQQGLLDKARQDLDKALELKPDFVAALLSRGLVFQAMARTDPSFYALAAADFEKAAEIEPENAYAWVAKGAAEAASGAPWHALQSYERAVQIDSAYALAWNNLAILAMSRAKLVQEMGREINGHSADDYIGKAVWALEHLVAMQPDLDVRTRLASAYGAAGMEREADSLFSVLVAEAPENLQVRQERAEFFMDAGRDADFIREIEEITKIDPENYHALVQLGRHYADRGLVTKAREYLNRAKELHPGDGLAYVVAGAMYKDLANRLEEEGSEAKGSPARKAKWSDAKDTFRKALDEFKRAVTDPEVGDYARNMVDYCSQMIARQDTLILYEDYY